MRTASYGYRPPCGGVGGPDVACEARVGVG